MFLSLYFLQAYGQTIQSKVDTVNVESGRTIKKHNPAKATVYSAVLPGLGQLYNNKWWKVPIVYGGFVGLGITIYNYNKNYLDYKHAYYDINDSDPNTKYYEEVWPKDDFSEIDDAERRNNLSDRMVVYIEETRRSRDLFYIISAGFYLLNILDANIDAHFIDFDISEDLTFNFEPCFVDPITNSPILGGHLAITF